MNIHIPIWKQMRKWKRVREGREGNEGKNREGKGKERRREEGMGREDRKTDIFLTEKSQIVFSPTHTSKEVGEWPTSQLCAGLKDLRPKQSMKEEVGLRR